MTDDLEKNAQPGLQAVIREDECIGCTKCIKPCPTDAILGAAKAMHTIIADACTGCELCVPTCPVDCIDMVTIPEKPSTHKQQVNMTRWRIRHQQQEIRLAQDQAERRHKHQQAKLVGAGKQTVAARKAAIQAAVARAKVKRKSL